MTKLRIDPALVERVLLVDGWHKITRGSLVVSKGYEFSEDIRSEKWAFKAMEAGMELSGPATSILAYLAGSK